MSSVHGRPGGDLLSHALRRSTIGAEGFHGRVRDGIGWVAPRCDHQTVNEQIPCNKAEAGQGACRACDPVSGVCDCGLGFVVSYLLGSIDVKPAPPVPLSLVKPVAVLEYL